MKMHVLSGGRLKMKSHIFMPDGDRDEYLDMPVSCFLLRHEQGNVLYDTGCHPDIATDPADRWKGLEKVMVPVHGPGEELISNLQNVGAAPDDIDLVINSHLHSDHCGCNAFFKNASFICHEAELKVAADPQMEGLGYFKADWDNGLGFDAIDGQKDVFNDERIVLVPLPGHTPGLIAALVNLDTDGSFLLCSDALSMRANLVDDFAPKNSWNAELLLKSYDEIRVLEGQGIQVLCGHDAEQWEMLKKGADAYA